MCVLLALAGCASEPKPAPIVPVRDPHTQMAALETRIFELIQTERSKIDPNAKTLMLDSELVGAARRHAADMARKNYLAHASPTGETTDTIIMDEDAQFQGLLGENIALVYFNPKLNIDVNAMAQQFVNIWLQSPKHRETLSGALYDRSGVGAAVTGNSVYVTELFATNLGLPPAPLDATQDRSAPTVGGSQGMEPDGATSSPAVPVPAARPNG